MGTEKDKQKKKKRDRARKNKIGSRGVWIRVGHVHILKFTQREGNIKRFLLFFSFRFLGFPFFFPRTMEAGPYTPKVRSCLSRFFCFFLLCLCSLVCTLILGFFPLASFTL